MAWFVDDRCINCAASRHVAPGLLIERGGQSVFARQPSTEDELRMAWMARELCPTRSVRTETSVPRPEGLYPHRLAEGVYLCGHNARSSYGAHAYFIQRPDGNILVDAPQLTRLLLEPFEAMGGIAKIVLSHRDDVADAEKYAKHFGAEVYIHRDEADAAPFATQLLGGEAPDQTTDIGQGLRIVPLPGHTKGSVALLVDDTFLFTGDSLCWSEDGAGLHAFRDVCWYSWPRQAQSLAGLAAHRFAQVFPGHGIWSPRLDPAVMHQHLLDLVDRM